MTIIHPNAPPKLVNAFQKAGSFHRLSQNIGVNVFYVHKLMIKGEEPNDTTPKLREIRHRLGLRKYKPSQRPKPPPAPKHLVWWNHIGKEMRHAIIEKIHQGRKP